MIQRKQCNKIQSVDKVGVDLEPAPSCWPGCFLYCFSDHHFTHPVDCSPYGKIITEFFSLGQYSYDYNKYLTLIKK